MSVEGSGATGFPQAVRRLEVLFSPTEFAALPGRDLSGTTCIVFDVLRATSTMLQALANGATAIHPVSTIPEALALKTKRSQALLAGERDGLRIRSAQTGGPDFDLGNSPREFTQATVSGREIVMTTTNGTRALSACRGAGEVLICSFANIGATASYLAFRLPSELLVVCSGTQENASFEDTLGAGTLVDRLRPHYEDAGGLCLDDSAVIAHNLFELHRNRLGRAAALARNGRRLLANPDLADDVPLCFALDRLDLVARLEPDGAVRVANG